MSRLLLVAFQVSTILALPALSQSLLRGIVRDSLTGAPLPSATVAVEGTRLGATTNEKGFYLILNVPSGTQTVVCRLVGYVPALTGVTLSVDADMTLNFRLHPAPVELEEVKVIVEPLEREEPKQMALETLARSEISAVPSVLQQDVLRAIQVLPGIVTVGDVASRFYVRGGRGDQNLILLDGMPIYNPFHALGLFSIFDAEIVRTVKVYRSNYPAEYGQRLSSVIDVMTKIGNLNRLEAKANVSLLSGAVVAEGPLVRQRSSWVLAVRRTYFDRFLKRILGEPIPLSFYDAFGSATFQIGDFGSVAVKAFASGDELREVSATDPRYRWRNAGGTLSISNPFARKTFAEARVWFTEYEVRREVKPSASVMPARNRVRDFGVLANMVTYGPRGDQLTVGFTFGFPETTYELTNAIGHPVTLTGLRLIGDGWIGYLSTFGTAFTFDLGLRTNIAFLVGERRYREALEPRIFAMLGSDRAVQLKGSYGRFHQALITVTNEDDLVPLFEAWITLPKNIDIQEVDHYLLAAELALPGFSKMELQAYWKSYRSLALYNRDKIDETDPDYIKGSGKSYGVELSWEREARGLSSRVNYTLAWAEVSDAGLAYRPRYDQRHVANLLAGFRFGSGWNFGIRWELSSGAPFSPIKGFYDRLSLRDLFRQGPEGERGESYMIRGGKSSARLPAYHRLDVSGSKLFLIGRVKMAISLNVINLYDRKNIFYFDANTGERVNMLPFLPTLEINVQY